MWQRRITRSKNASTSPIPTWYSGTGWSIGPPWLTRYRRWLDPLLRDACRDADARRQPRRHLHASLALLPVDAAQVDYLLGRLLAAEPHEVPVIRDALRPHHASLIDRLWGAVESPARGKEQQRLRAAAALASYDPDSLRWAVCSGKVAEDLVSVNPVLLGAGPRRSVRSRTSSSPRCASSSGTARPGGRRSVPWRPTSWRTTPPTSRRCWPTSS
jgi:hypothetical protein